MTENGETLLICDEKDERDYPFSMIPVWVNYSGLSNAAYRLYATLRSVAIEGDHKGTRKLLDADLCELISRAQGKPITTRTLDRWRDELVEMGLLKIDKIPMDTPGAGRPRMMRRYRLVKYPRRGREVVRSAWDLLRDIQSERERGEEAHPLPPAVISPTKMSENSEELNFPTKMSVNSLKMSENYGADLQRRGLKNPRYKNPPPSPTPSTRLAARKGARSGRKEEEKDIKDFSHTHLERVKGLVLELPGSVDADQAGEITRFVCAALDRGWAPSAVVGRLRERCDLEKAKDPGAIHLRNARLLGEPSRAQRANAVLELCGVCDEHGFTPEEPACSRDPRAVPGLCLHGQPDPWDDGEYRARREQEHAEALYAHQKAQEAARDREARQERARAQEAARRLGETARRRKAAREFLETAEPLGDETADAVRCVLLSADDPADLPDLPDLVDAGIGFVESGRSLPEMAGVLGSTPREEWFFRLMDRPEVTA